MKKLAILALIALLLAPPAQAGNCVDPSTLARSTVQIAAVAKNPGDADSASAWFLSPRHIATLGHVVGYLRTSKNAR